MPDAERTRQVEVIEKLRNLAQRAAGSAEGKAAGRKARELMARYGITTDELKRHRQASQTPQESAKAKPRAKTAPADLTLRLGSLRIRLKL